MAGILCFPMPTFVAVLIEPRHPLSVSFPTFSGDTFLQLMKQDIGSDPSGIPMAIGPLLVLPQNFGNIFLGETFSSYISVHNDSGSSVTSVTIKVEQSKLAP